MKYLIIGGESVFTKPLTQLLKLDDDDAVITVTHNDPQSKIENEEIINLFLDIRDAAEVKSVIKKTEADYIFIIESQTSVGYAWKNPKETVDINVIGTINILNAVKESNRKVRLIIGGSGEEYGNVGFDRLPVDEEEPPHPINIFGATKAAQTMFSRLYSKAFDIDVVVLRTFNETSVLQDDKWAISSICKQFVKIEKGAQEPVIHVGNVGITRDFTDVDDLARAFIDVARKGKKGEIYNAARGEGVSLSEVLGILCDITGINPEIRMDRSKVRPIDVPCITADISKIKKDTGWFPQKDIRDTLNKMIEMWRECI